MEASVRIKDMQDMMDWNLWPMKKSIWAERTASAKALSQECT